MSAFARTVWVITRKDLLVEARTREILFTTLFFAVACVMVFAFGFVREGRPVSDAAAGILWIAIAFSGTLALGRAFERERQGETLRALLIAPIVIGFFLSGDVLDDPHLGQALAFGMFVVLGLMMLVYIPLQRVTSRWVR